MLDFCINFQRLLQLSNIATLSHSDSSGSMLQSFGSVS
jgi:hypothetical protein